MKDTALLIHYLKECHALALTESTDYSADEIAHFEAVNRLRAWMRREHETNGFSPLLRELGSTFERYCQRYIHHPQRFHDYNEQCFLAAVAGQIKEGATWEDVQTLMCEESRAHPPREYYCL